MTTLILVVILLCAFFGGSLKALLAAFLAALLVRYAMHFALIATVGGDDQLAVALIEAHVKTLEPYTDPVRLRKALQYPSERLMLAHYLHVTDWQQITSMHVARRIGMLNAATHARPDRSVLCLAASRAAFLAAALVFIWPALFGVMLTTALVLLVAALATRRLRATRMAAVPQTAAPDVNLLPAYAEEPEEEIVDEDDAEE